MVRQYKIHTNLDGTDDKVWDVTNGKVRFYQPSNLGLQSTNNIWQSNGIGVMGTRSITQPQIEFKLETFGETLEENYQLIKDFVNDILNQKFITLEYQTEIFQVYADLALSDVTKTEGYGKNGTFSEKITFDIITKWYTYENLTFNMIQNGQVISGKSKIYGGYKGSETALQNYNRLKANPSLNLPNLNLWRNTKSQSYTSTGTAQNLSANVYSLDAIASDLIGKDIVITYDYIITNSTGVWSGFIRPTAGFGGTNYPVSDTNLKGSVTQFIKNVAAVNQSSYPILTIGLPAGTTVTITNLKVEISSIGTPWFPSSSELKTSDISEYFGYNYILNQAYTYYGETNIDRLSRWDIKDEIFSFVGILYPRLAQQVAGVRFLDTVGNEYTAIVFNPKELQDYILINTDVNDEIYQGWNGTTSLNLFPVLDFERYRTRIIEEGQMELINLKKAEFKVKRKADFV